MALGLGLSLLILLELLLRWTDLGLFPAVEKVGLPLYECRDSGPGTKLCETSKYYRGPVADEKFIMPKPATMVRIFCMGESTTAGYPFLKPGAFPYFLSLALNTADLSRHYEVINSGVVMSGSYEVKEYLREVLRYDPDLIVMYLGHNEYLARTDQNERGWRGRFGHSLRRYLVYSRIYKLMQGLISSLQSPNPALDLQPVSAADYLQKAGAFRAQAEVKNWDESVRGEVRERYRQNLQEMIRMTKARKTVLVLCTLPINLRDFPPFGKGREVQASDCKSEPGPPPADCERVKKDDPRFAASAALAYLAGKCALEQGNPGAAKDYFWSAADRDPLPRRAETYTNRMIREAARSEAVPLADLEQLFSDLSDAQCPGDDLFVDNVHPNLPATALLALELVKTMKDQGLITLPPNWQSGSEAEVSHYISRMPREYLFNSYYTLAAVQTTIGDFCRARWLIEQAILIAPEESRGQTLKAIIDEILKDQEAGPPANMNIIKDPGGNGGLIDQSLFRKWDQLKK